MSRKAAKTEVSLGRRAFFGLKNQENTNTSDRMGHKTNTHLDTPSDNSDRRNEGGRRM
jgi:hypothetical protein